MDLRYFHKSYRISFQQNDTTGGRKVLDPVSLAAGRSGDDTTDLTDSLLLTHSVTIRIP